VLVATIAGAADPHGTAVGRAALEGCETARRSDDAGALDRAVEQAEAAVRAVPDDPLAHFALFCSLGERMRMRGTSLRSLFELRRLRSAIDRTIDLAPEFPDALVGKANLLLDAPRILGGDAHESERLLRRALSIDSGYLRGRRDLARVLARLGEHAGARQEALRALADAEREGDSDDVAAAQTLLSSLED